MNFDALSPEALVGFFDRLPDCDRSTLSGLLGSDRYAELERRVSETRQDLARERTPDEELQPHLAPTALKLLKGGVIPFLGAAASTYERQAGVRLSKVEDFRGDYLPTASELATYLAMKCDPPFPDEARKHDLILVSQWLQLAGGGKTAVTEPLREIFNRDRQPTGLHRLLATLPHRSRQYAEALGQRPTYPIFFTTNYDDLLGQALADAGEPFDVLAYIAEGEDDDGQDLSGKFRHYTYAFDEEKVSVRVLSPDDYEPAPAAEDFHRGTGKLRDPDRIHLTRSQLPGPETPEQLFGIGREITELTGYLGPEVDTRPLIIKVHGAVDRKPVVGPDHNDSYVITEDDYLDFLPRTRLSSLFPKRIVRRLRRRSFLFLGYGLQDWNLRAMIRVLQSKNRDTSWAVQRSPDQIERFFWKNRDVRILDMELDRYVSALDEATKDLIGAGE